MRLTVSRQPHPDFLILYSGTKRPLHILEALRHLMTVRRFMIPAALLASIIANSPATAASADVARKWGLLGRWAVDCEHTVTKGGPHNLISYEATREGKMFYRRNDQ